MERIQKYGADPFLVLNRNGNKLNPDIKEDDKGKNLQSSFNTNYTDIPKLVDKAISVARDINPLVTIIE
jgi:hypothetical protein